MNRICLLDGGTGRELLRIGAPFAQPEWSALALIQGPQFVTQVHEAFVAAGADVITTNSYAVVPFHLGQSRFERDGHSLAALSGHWHATSPTALCDLWQSPAACRPCVAPTGRSGSTLIRPGRSWPLW